MTGRHRLESSPADESTVLVADLAATVGEPIEPVEAPAAPEGALARSSFRGTLWLSVQAWSTNLASLAVFIVLGRLLTPESFGLVGSASVVVLFLRTLVDSGVSKQLIRLPKLTGVAIDTAFWMAVSVGSLLTVIYCSISPLISLAFGEPRLTVILLALAPIIGFAALDRTQSALLDRAMAFRVQATRTLVASLVSAGLAIAAAVLGAGVWSLVIQAVSYEFIALVLLWTLTSWRPRFRFSRQSARELLGFGIGTQGLQVLGYLSQNVDNFLIGIFLGPISLGVYVVGYRVLIVMDEVLSMTLRRVALPAFARVQHDPKLMRHGLGRMSAMSGSVILPCAAGLLVVAPHLVPAVFGAKWHDSIHVMQALTGAAIVQASINPLRYFVLASGRVKTEVRWAAGFTLAEVIGFLVAAQFSVLVVALVLSGVSLVYWPLRVWSLRSLMNLRPADYWRPWARPVVAATIMAAVVALVGRALPTSSPQGAQLAVEVVVGLVVFPMALFLVDRPLVRDVIRLARPLP